LRPEQLIELKLSTEKIQLATGEYERAGLKFLKMILFLEEETVTTDRIQVTEEAVRSFNQPHR
jgi:hypothetical protein